METAPLRAYWDLLLINEKFRILWLGEVRSNGFDTVEQRKAVLMVA